MRDVWKYSALWPVAAGTLPPYWENGKMVEQAQNRRILTGRLTCAVHPLQTLLLCAQKEEVSQRVRAMEKERSVLVSMALMKGITGFKELKKSRLTYLQSGISYISL